MKRALFLLLLALVGNAQPIAETLTATILSVDKKGALIDQGELAKGTSGIVVHHFDTKHASIVAQAVVEESSKTQSKIRFEVFDVLAQSALPTPNISPKTGDKVILGHFYDRALAISPNLLGYQSITQKYKNITWVHPDLFAAQLSKDHKVTPKREDFVKFCKINSVGLIYFAIENSGYFVDCTSFAVLSKEELHPSDHEVLLPFYSRIEKIEKGLFDFFGSETIENYATYYKNVMEGK